MIAKIIDANPTNVPIIVRSKILMRCLMQQAINPANVEKKVANNMGKKMSDGLLAPNCARYIITPMGIMVSPDVFNTRNMIIASVAVSLSLFRLCISLIAFNPSGVAALSNPNMFAEIFIKMDPIAGCWAGIPGKSLEKSGLTIRAKNRITPPFSPTFISPSQSERIPVSPKDISNAVLDELKVASITSDHKFTFP